MKELENESITTVKQLLIKILAYNNSLAYLSTINKIKSVL